MATWLEERQALGKAIDELRVEILKAFRVSFMGKFLAFILKKTGWAK